MTTDYHEPLAVPSIRYSFCWGGAATERCRFLCSHTDVYTRLCWNLDGWKNFHFVYKYSFRLRNEA